MDVIAKLERHMNRQEKRIATAFLDGDLALIFQEDATQQQRALGCHLLSRACRVLADIQHRHDLPVEVRRAAAIVHAAGFFV